MEKLLEKLRRFFHDGFHLAVLDLEAGRRWIVESKPSSIPYLKAENAQGRHILIQPLSQAYYLLVDDVPPDTLLFHHKFNNGVWKPGRMVIETSPDNYQVWVHAHRPLPLDEKRYWLKRLKSDPGADPSNRWGRSPGFRNRKKKYRDASGKYPLARLIWINWKRNAHIPKPKTTQPLPIRTYLSPQPLEGGVCHAVKIFRYQYERGNESATDFAYAMAIIRRGGDDNYVRHCLLAERADWSHHDGSRRKEAYLKRSIRRARCIVEST
jgi:RepB DNA-primase N-terminal domain